MNESGIYEIVNRENGKRYVGSTASFDVRFKAHRTGLFKGTHHSRYLQKTWNKHGSAAFSFRPLLICATKDLLLYEQIAIDALRPQYNIASDVRRPMIGRKHAQESLEKMSASQQGNVNGRGNKGNPATWLVGNSHTKGKKRSPEAVAKTAAAHTGMKRSDETRAKIAAKALGRKRSAESIERGAAKLRGRPVSPQRAAQLIGNTYALGTKLSAERRAQISLQMTGVPRPKSAGHRAKISAALKGRTATPERRARQSAAQLGKKRGPYKTKERA